MSLPVAKSPEVVSLGEMMVMLVAEETGPLRTAELFRKHVAGSEANVAIGLARLGHRPGWVSRLGEDEWGVYIRNFLRGEGVDVSQVIFDPEHPTGVAFKERRELGARRVVYYRRGSAASHLRPQDLNPDYFVGARFFHTSGINPAISASAHETVRAAIALARQAGAVVTFDPNVRLKLWDAATCRKTLREIIPSCDIVLPGQEEAELLTGETDPIRAARAILTLGTRMVIVKVGAEGSIAVSEEGIVRAPALRLERIVDPVGAGDGFAAGFLSGQLRGLGLTESLRLGNLVGAAAMTVSGDVEGLPTWEEVQALESQRDVAR
ncbi:MAG TPA: sugar kinase [Chloroflexota bacterium]|nr:sugar kinase [Chloroflexota bacterium]